MSISEGSIIILLIIIFSLTLIVYGFIQLNSLSIYDENIWKSIRTGEALDTYNFGVIGLESGGFAEIPFVYRGDDSLYSNYTERILAEREAFGRMAPELFDYRWLIIKIETDHSKVNVFLLNFDQWYRWYRYKGDNILEPSDYILSFRNVSKLDKLIEANDTFYEESEPNHLKYCRFEPYFIVLVENPNSGQIKLKYFVADHVAVLTPYTYMLEGSPGVYKYILFGSILMWLSLAFITPELGLSIMSLLSKFMPQEIEEGVSKFIEEYRLWNKRKYVKAMFFGSALLAPVITYLHAAFILGLPHGFLACNIIFRPPELRNLEGSYLQLLELDLYLRENMFIDLLFLSLWFSITALALSFLVFPFLIEEYLAKKTNMFIQVKVVTTISANLLILTICLASVEAYFARTIEIFLLKSSPATKILGVDTIHNFLCENYCFFYPCEEYPFPPVSLENMVLGLITVNVVYWGLNGACLLIASTLIRYTYNTALYRILAEERRRFKTNLIMTILTALIVYPVSSFLSNTSVTLENLVYSVLLALTAPILTEFYTKEYIRHLIISNSNPY